MENKSSLLQKVIVTACAIFAAAIISLLIYGIASSGLPQTEQVHAESMSTKQDRVEEYVLTSIDAFSKTTGSKTTNYLVYSFIMPNGLIEARSRADTETADKVFISENVTIEFKLSETLDQKIVQTYLDPEEYLTRYQNKINLVFWLDQDTYNEIIAKAGLA